MVANKKTKGKKKIFVIPINLIKFIRTLSKSILNTNLCDLMIHGSMSYIIRVSFGDECEKGVIELSRGKQN